MMLAYQKRFGGVIPKWLFNQRDFRKDKPKAVNVPIVCSVKILTFFERTVK